ncbi:oxidoreductase [Thermaurantimonas aggregans]|uniref:Oxidoreductase n=1 Tax=Thermaurantimonas aggregans TaxID=2173829 RepID=A0A401XJK8_9FLAO|nr:FAD-binding and (Fe-S)-binding domain-containing protein [Thermaurantimonas aggregans]MCX8148717.1 FAD-binding protein [Thermaurantimonas aggregans]GCD77183.1 oxidoreductase [Thermaurantimonas aggregans]
MYGSDFNIELLSRGFKGEVYDDILRRALYATDASIYKEYPLAVVYPRDEQDVKILVDTCREKSISIIPRTAGTSLAGQCVGSGVVADMSKYMTRVLHLDLKNGIVKVQPGVIRDSLNEMLKPYGWFFGPNTSTSNRCMLGGMVANNSSGSTSIKYGVTRDKVLSIRGVLSNGEVIELSEGKAPHSIQSSMIELLSDTALVDDVQKNFPKRTIHRRNTGYALDVLIDQLDFGKGTDRLNLAKLISGSEGTLLLMTEITLKLDRLPPKEVAVICAHFTTIRQSMEAAKEVMKVSPYACELVDKIILDCTKENLEQRENRFFIEGDPEAILAVELRADEMGELQKAAETTIARLKEANLGYAFPVLWNEDAEKIWSLRAAGLGLLSNIPGPAKAIACIEDTAVDIEDLPDYIDEFDQMMEKFGQRSVHYAHAGAGEIHLRPILNLRELQGYKHLRQISTESARLVKKYNGSLSGEHGDGRVRAEFIEEFYGSRIYEAFLKVKQIFDPYNLFNPGKIVNAPPMDTSLREDPSTPLQTIDTFFDYGNEGGFLAAVEKCNGSGDCRKPFSTGGTMCPSYQATLDEKDTTRARANALREFVSGAANGKKGFAHPELKEVMDLCLACKGCTRECPSNVDMASMKSEWLYQYQSVHGKSLSTLFFGHFDLLARWASLLPSFSNALLENRITGDLIKRLVGIATQRKLPTFAKTPLQKQINKTLQKNPKDPVGSVYFFLDEFINYNEPRIGIKAIELLQRYGYEVKFVRHASSGRAMISKGLLPEARKVAERNVKIFSEIVNENVPLVGIEPSAILSFRDEYPRIVRQRLWEKAKRLAQNVLLLDEFFAREIKAGRLKKLYEEKDVKTVHVHGHCHQKALSSLRYTREVLEFFGYKVKIIPSGCCGMAGSFGYEKEHFDLSMKIGEMVLFPYLRSLNDMELVVAVGTSCRHQIADGVGRKALHWVEIVN